MDTWHLCNMYILISEHDTFYLFRFYFISLTNVLKVFLEVSCPSFISCIQLLFFLIAEMGVFEKLFTCLMFITGISLYICAYICLFSVSFILVLLCLHPCTLGFIGWVFPLLSNGYLALWMCIFSLTFLFRALNCI